MPKPPLRRKHPEITGAQINRKPAFCNRLLHRSVSLTIFWKNVQKNFSVMEMFFVTDGFTGKWLRVLFWTLGIAVFVGCKTVSFPPVSLDAPGWTTFTGQAVWKPNFAAPELAGEILVATNSNGQTFIQFTKTPFPLVVAQRNGTGWQLEIPAQNKKYAAPGRPPGRLIWLYIPTSLSSGVVPERWKVNHSAFNHWTFSERNSGESVELVLTLPLPATYQVKPGDSLRQIAEWFAVDYKSLLSLNPGIEARSLRAGDVLKLPAE